MASKKNKPNKPAKTAKKTAKKKAPPPKVETRGKRVKVTFEDKEQVDEVLAEDAERTSFALDDKEIAARKKEAIETLDRLKIRRETLGSLSRERDATKAEIAATDLGRKLEQLKEDIKKEEVAIAAQQDRHELLSWEILHKRTFEYQRPLNLEDEDDEEKKPAPAKAKQTEMPLEPEPPQAPAPPALPAPVRDGVIDADFEDPAKAVRVSLAKDLEVLLREHGPLSTEELCAHLGREERDAGNWKDVQEALELLHAVRQEGRWWLPEHLRALPAAPGSPPAPPEPAPAGLLPAPSGLPTVAGPQEPEVPLDDLEAPPAATTVAEDAAAIFEALQHAPQWTLSGAQIIGKTDLSVDALAAALDRLHSEGRLMEASMAPATAPDVDRLFTLARDEDKVPPPPPPSGPKGGKKGRDKAQGKLTAPVAPSAGKASKNGKAAHAKADRDVKPENVPQAPAVASLQDAIQALLERDGGMGEMQLYASLVPQPNVAALQEALKALVEAGRIYHRPGALGGGYTALIKPLRTDAPATPSLDEQVRAAILDELRTTGEKDSSETWLRNRLGKRMPTPTYEVLGAALQHLVAAGELVERQHGARRLYALAPSLEELQPLSLRDELLGMLDQAKQGLGFGAFAVGLRKRFTPEDIRVELVALRKAGFVAEQEKGDETRYVRATLPAPAVPSEDRQQIRDELLEHLADGNAHPQVMLRLKFPSLVRAVALEELEALVREGKAWRDGDDYMLASSSPPASSADEDDNRPAPILTPADDARRLLAERGEISGPQELCELFKWDAGDTGQWAAALAALQEVGEKTPHGTWRSRQGSGKQAAE